MTVYGRETRPWSATRPRRNPTLVRSQPDVEVAAVEETPSQSYRRAKDVLRAHDAVGWRDLQKHQRITLEQRLTTWRARHEADEPRDRETLERWVDEAIGEIGSVVATSLAQSEFPTIQLGAANSIVNDLLTMPTWNQGGLTVLIELPQALVYVVQNLLGAVSVAINDVEGTVTLARTPLPERTGDMTPLIRCRHLIGWPKSLGGNADEAWHFLLSLPERHDWLEEVFGSVHDFRASIVGYWWRLTFLEFASTVVAGQLDALLKSEHAWFDVPPVWLYEERSLRDRGYRLAFPNAGAVHQLASWSGASEHELRSGWGDWTGLLARALARSRRGFFFGDPDPVLALP